MDAPKRIWAWPFNSGWHGGYYRDNKHAIPEPEKNGSDYILAAEHDRLMAEKDARIAALEAMMERIEAKTNWKYCPECGSLHASEQCGNLCECESCGQEWFVDIDYTDVVRAHLRGQYTDARQSVEYFKKRAKTARNKALEEAARMVDCGCECREAVLSATTETERWSTCGCDPCGALVAAAIRAMKG